jgi:hypothetical protein
MPLPKIAVPKYTLTIPSNKKKVSYRPYLVKEQKILLMALESDDETQILNAMCNIIRDCFEGVQDPMSLAMFDIEYMFAMLRAKSAGESVELKVVCPACSKENLVSAPIDGLEVKFPENITNKIMLTDTLGIILRYPSMSDAARDIKQMDADGLIEYICSSMDMIFDADQVYPTNEYTPKELKDFVESLNSIQFEKIIEFYANLPKLHKSMPCTCSSCKEKFSIDFNGLKDFFI